MKKATEINLEEAKKRLQAYLDKKNNENNIITKREKKKKLEEKIAFIKKTCGWGYLFHILWFLRYMFIKKDKISLERGYFIQLTIDRIVFPEVADRKAEVQNPITKKKEYISLIEKNWEHWGDLSMLIEKQSENTINFLTENIKLLLDDTFIDILDDEELDFLSDY